MNGEEIVNGGLLRDTLIFTLDFTWMCLGISKKKTFDSCFCVTKYLRIFGYNKL